MLLSLLLTTSLCFSQKDISKTDTLICLPKSYLIKAVQEIKAYDFVKAELGIFKENYYIVQQQLLLKDDIITEYESKENKYKENIDNLSHIVSSKKYKRQRNAIIIGGVSLTVTLGISIIYVATVL
jgi:hypothetical protein